MSATGRVVGWGLLSTVDANLFPESQNTIRGQTVAFDAVQDYVSALCCAVELNHADVVEVLIGAGADMEANNNNGGAMASKLGHLRVVEVLVEAGAGVCVTHNQGDTCLSGAAARTLNEGETQDTVCCEAAVLAI